MTEARQAGVERMRLPVYALQTGQELQARCGIDGETVDAYAEALLDGQTFPPVVAFFDGETYWLGDGHHRVKAAIQADVDDIDAEVHPGGRREAVLHAIGANVCHGLRRTNQDKRRAVELLLADSEWSQWADREIARRVGVSPDTVGRVRRASLSESDSETGSPRTYTTKHGTRAVMHTGAIGGKPDGAPGELVCVESATDDPAATTQDDEVARWQCGDCGRTYVSDDYPVCPNCGIVRPELPPVRAKTAALGDCKAPGKPKPGPWEVLESDLRAIIRRADDLAVNTTAKAYARRFGNGVWRLGKQILDEWRGDRSAA